MMIVGLTGGIGSGKTTVANLFATKNIPIIDTDQLAHELTEVGTFAYKKITDHFGNVALLSDNTLNRRALSRIVFSQENEKRWLESLLHPLILEAVQEKIKTLKSAYCIVVIPLLIEVSPYQFIDRVLVVDTPETLQIERIINRDNLTRDHINKIMASQVSRSLRLSKAHDIINNEGNIEDLEKQVEELHQRYLMIADKKNK